MTNRTTKRRDAKNVSQSLPPKTDDRPPKKTPRTTKKSTAKTEHEALRVRAQAIIDNDAIKVGHRYHVEEFLAREKWDDLATVVEAIEQGRSYSNVIIRNDDRTLSDETIAAVCKELASHLEEEDLAGCFFALLEHLSAAAQSIEVEIAIYDIRRHFLTNNAHGTDKAARLLRTSALEALGKDKAKGDESE